jgi:hypothetical protein
LRGLPTEALTLAKTLFSRKVKHGVSQQPIRFGLVTVAIGLCSNVVNDVQIAVGTIVVSQPKISADRLSIRSIHLNETCKGQMDLWEICCPVQA